MSNILVTRSSMPSYEEYCEEIKDLWNSHWLTNMGPKHKKFQKEFEIVFEKIKQYAKMIEAKEDSLKKSKSQPEVK